MHSKVSCSEVLRQDICRLHEYPWLKSLLESGESVPVTRCLLGKNEVLSCIPENPQLRNASFSDECAVTPVLASKERTIPGGLVASQF